MSSRRSRRFALAVAAALATTAPAAAQLTDLPVAVRMIEEGRAAEAVPILAALADAGLAEAQLRLGLLYRSGNGVAADLARAAALFRAAADLGNAEAQFHLANAYLRGEGIELNFDQALALYRAAAEQDYPPAILNVGFRYYNGNEGVAQDYAEALRWFDRAARFGLPQAKYLIGILYSSGRGVPQNFDKAFAWMWQAAQGGFGGGAYAVGVAYTFGDGVTANPVEAFRWIYTALRITGYPPGSPIYQAAVEAGQAIAPEQREKAEAGALAWMALRGIEPRQ